MCIQVYHEIRQVDIYVNKDDIHDITHCNNIDVNTNDIHDRKHTNDSRSVDYTGPLRLRVGISFGTPWSSLGVRSFVALTFLPLLSFMCALRQCIEWQKATPHVLQKLNADTLMQPLSGLHSSTPHVARLASLYTSCTSRLPWTHTHALSTRQCVFVCACVRLLAPAAAVCMCAGVRVCMCALRACVRACARVCVCVCVCKCVRVRAWT